MALAETIAMNNYLTMFRVKNPLETEAENYLSIIQHNLKTGFYSPKVTECIADVNLPYAYSCSVLVMNTSDNKALKEFRDDVRKIALNGITCEELYSIVDGIEKKIY
jgi:hypothetical protein